MFPAGLRKELSEVMHHGLVINRDMFEPCLVLYTKPEWDKVLEEMGRLNRYDPDHQKFLRRFMMNATRSQIDSSGRILIPQLLQEYAGINGKENNEVVVSAMGNKIEVWSLSRYQAEQSDDGDFKSLAVKVGRIISGNGPAE